MIRRLVLKKDVRAEYAKLRADHPAKVALSIARYNCKMRASPFYRASDGEVIQYKSKQFTVRFDADAFPEKPWENSEPLAEVKESTYSPCHEAQPEKGWVWLDGPPTSRTYGYLYNRAAALAAVSKWGHDYKARAAQIVDAEIDRFGSWLRDGWRYVSVGLERDGLEEWLGGVEDDCAEYIAELLEGHAAQLMEREGEDARREMLRRAFC